MRIYAGDTKQRYRITVDEIEITEALGLRPFAADDEQGWVDAFALRDGAPYIDYPCAHRERIPGCVCEHWINRLVTHRLFGRVEIALPDGQESR